MSFLVLGFKMDQLIDLILICSCLWIFCWNSCLKEVTSYSALIWFWNYDIYIYIIDILWVHASHVQVLHIVYILHVQWKLFLSPYFLFFTTMQTLLGYFRFAVESTPCLFGLYPRVATRSEISISESFLCYDWCIGSCSIMPKTPQNTRAVLWIRVRFLIWFRLSFALPIVCSCHGWFSSAIPWIILWILYTHDHPWDHHHLGVPFHSGNARFRDPVETKPG